VDPHIDAALAHDPGKDNVELVPPNLVVLFDIGRRPRLPFLGFGRRLELNQQTEHEQQAQAA